MAEHLIHIGETIVNGVLFDPKNTEAWRSMDVEGLYRAVPRLFDLLQERGVQYALVGGIAMLAYVEGRNTQDIDLILSAGDLKKVPEIRIEEQNPEFARAWFGELRVDFWFRMQNTPHTGVIRDVHWDAASRSIHYFLEEAGQPVPTPYVAEDLQKVEPTPPFAGK